MPDPVLGVISQTQNKWIVFSYIYESKKQQRGGEPANWKRCCPGLHSASMINTTDSLVTQRPRWYPNWTPKRKIINNYRILHPVWIINHLKKLVDPRAGGDCIFFFFSKRGCYQHWKYWWNDLMSAICFKIIWKEGKLGLAEWDPGAGWAQRWNVWVTLSIHVEIFQKIPI